MHCTGITWILGIRTLVLTVGRQELYPLSHLSSHFPIFLVQLDLLYLYSYIYLFKLPMHITLLTNSFVKHCPARKTSWGLYPARVYGRALYLSQECWQVGEQQQREGSNPGTSSGSGAWIPFKLREKMG